MIANEAIRNLVREGKSRQMRNMIATGGEQGMQTIEMDLARLVAAGLIAMETATESSQYPKEVQAQLATARAQLQAQATLSTGQSGSSGSGTFTSEGTLTRPDRPRPSRIMVVKQLPYKNLAGVTACPGGWLVLPARLAGITVSCEDAFVVQRLFDVLGLSTEVRLRPRSTFRLD